MKAQPIRRFVLPLCFVLGLLYLGATPTLAEFFPDWCHMDSTGCRGAGCAFCGFYHPEKGESPPCGRSASAVPCACNAPGCGPDYCDKRCPDALSDKSCDDPDKGCGCGLWGCVENPTDKSLYTCGEHCANNPQYEPCNGDAALCACDSNSDKGCRMGEGGATWTRCAYPCTNSRDTRPCNGWDEGDSDAETYKACKYFGDDCSGCSSSDGCEKCNNAPDTPPCGIEAYQLTP